MQAAVHLRLLWSDDGKIISCILLKRLQRGRVKGLCKGLLFGFLFLPVKGEPRSSACMTASIKSKSRSGIQPSFQCE